MRDVIKRAEDLSPVAGFVRADRTKGTAYFTELPPGRTSFQISSWSRRVNTSIAWNCEVPVSRATGDREPYRFPTFEKRTLSVWCRKTSAVCEPAG